MESEQFNKLNSTKQIHPDEMIFGIDKMFSKIENSHSDAPWQSQITKKKEDAKKRIAVKNDKYKKQGMMPGQDHFILLTNWFMKDL